MVFTNKLRTACVLPLILYNCMECDSLVTFALFKMPKLLPAAGKSRYNLHYRPFLALICISYTRKLIILKTLRLVKCFVPKMMRKLRTI